MYYSIASLANKLLLSAIRFTRTKITAQKERSDKKNVILPNFGDKNDNINYNVSAVADNEITQSKSSLLPSGVPEITIGKTKDLLGPAQSNTMFYQNNDPGLWREDLNVDTAY
ncbi:hypothetical protein TNCT_159701 [Trichonephila clavata]|uniref:Uncharacterized protein n=1 Tax=Trichonephila clavata TaxID=2740835 RepID=A0A8X6JFH8_TRICU|nr:hypothetical protein TNCT_159701 [Trichonephila clavata]